MSASYEIILAVLMVVVAGVFRGFSGFGTGMILVPSLSLIYEPVTAVITVVLLELLTSIQLMRSSIPHCHWPTVIPMGLVSSVTVPLGALLLVSIDASTMRMVISVLVLLSVVILASGWRYKRATGISVSAVTGLSSGLITGATSLGGLPVILYYLSSQFSSQVARASMIMFLVLSTVVSLLSYMSHGIITQDIVMRTATVAPIFIMAIWFGQQLFGRVSETLFRKVILALLGAVSLLMLLGA